MAKIWVQSATKCLKCGYFTLKPTTQALAEKAKIAIVRQRGFLYQSPAAITPAHHKLLVKG